MAAFLYKHAAITLKLADQYIKNAGAVGSTNAYSFID